MSAATLLGVDRRILALGVARMADALGNSFLIVVLPLYVSSGQVTGDTFGLSTALVSGIVLALFGVANSLGQPFAGRLSDRLGRRKAFVVGGLLAFAAANFSLSLAGTYTTLIGVRILQGLSAALTVTATVALVNEISVTGNRGRNMGTYNAFRLTGFGAGPLLSGVVIEGGPYAVAGLAVTGFEAAFYIATSAALVSALLVALLVEDPDETEPTHDRLALQVWGRDTVLDPIFALGVVTFFMSACIALLSTIEPQVNVRLDQGPVLFSFEFAALVGALAVVQPFVGRASDTYGRRTFIALGLAGLAPTTLVQGFVVEPWQMIGARTLQGVSAAFVFAPALALAGDLARKGQSGAQLAVLTMAFGLGIATGQILSGALVAYGFWVPFAAGAGLALLGVAVVQTQVPRPQPAAASSATA